MNLKEKVALAEDSIRCWYEAWGGQVYVSFSGGKDSTVLAFLVRRLYPDVKLVFSNTGLEFPEIVKFVKTYENVDIVRPRIPFHKVVERWGWPVISKSTSCAISRYRNTKLPEQKQYRLWGKTVNGKKYRAGVIPQKYHHRIDAPFKISEECCTYLKKEPLKKYAKKSGKQPMTGIMMGDSHMRKRDILVRGCNVYDAKAPMSRPLGKWAEEDILQFIKEESIEICEIYSKGYDRTGCIFCMYGLQQEQKHTGTNRFQKMKKTHPKLWDYCMDKLGARAVLEYMGIDYE